MIRQELKRRNVIDHKKQQFAAPAYGPQEYLYRLNLYDRPPTAEITLEQFEQWAIDRLRSNHLESSLDACLSSDADGVQSLLK